MEKYHYQCSGCCCTLSADPLEEGEKWVYVLGGLCSSCQAEEDDAQDDDSCWDYDW